jgi:hypothetical protein
MTPIVVCPDFPCLSLSPFPVTEKVTVYSESFSIEKEEILRRGKNSRGGMEAEERQRV